MKYDILSFHCSPLTFGIMNHARKNKVWNRKGLQNVSGCVDKGIKITAWDTFCNTFLLTDLENWLRVKGPACLFTSESLFKDDNTQLTKALWTLLWFF